MNLQVFGHARLVDLDNTEIGWWSRSAHRRLAPHVHEQYVIVPTLRDGIRVIHPFEVHEDDLPSHVDVIRPIYPSMQLVSQLSSGQACSFPDGTVHDPPLARELLRVHESLFQDSRERSLAPPFTSVISHMIREHSVPVDPFDRFPEVSRRAIRAMLNRDPTEITLTEIARDVGVSPSHLSRTFARETGLPLWSYVRSIRCERARRLLLEPGSNIAMVAIETGFYDQSHLTTCFRRMFGITPARYVRSMKTCRHDPSVH